MMKDLLKEILKLLLPRGAPMRMVDPGAPKSSTSMIFKVVGKVDFFLASQIVAGCSWTAKPMKQKSMVIVPECGKTP